MTDRRFDLDWLRIAAFGLLILYHVGMFYVTWDWHVKSSRASDAIEPLMMLTSPWRLSLLFLVAGAASRFLWDKLSVGGFTTARMGRLWPPLLLAVFVIVPPQAYYEVVEAIRGNPAWEAAQFPLTLENFYVRYVTASGNWCDSDGCLTTPTYNHMWFVAYLILYTLALIPLAPLLKRVPERISVLIAGPFLLITPWLVMAALRITLMPIFGERHDFRVDWYLHALYLSVFVFGFAIAKYQPFFDACVRWRWIALAMALAAWAALITYFAAHPEGATPPDWLRNIFRAVREAEAWGAIVAAIGFAHKHLKHVDGPVRRLLTQAIFPFYLIHQTIIVIAGFHLDALRLPLWLEAPLLIGATALGCWLFYLMGRAVPPLRVWIGLPSKMEEKHASALSRAAGGAR
jgi:glucans biosynthesis protein C